MFRFATLLAAISFSCAASAAESEHPQALDDLIAHFARVHGIPESLVHRVCKRESGYNPHLIHRRFYGLMQITYQTAHSMGYKGKPKGLLDPEVNLTYAVPYLANAYKVANEDETGAVRLYASGYYYVAKRKHLLDVLRTADSPSLEPPPPPPPSPPQPAQRPNPVVELLQAVTGPLPLPAAQAAPPVTDPVIQPLASPQPLQMYGPPAPVQAQ